MRLVIVAAVIIFAAIDPVIGLVSAALVTAVASAVGLVVVARIQSRTAKSTTDRTVAATQTSADTAVIAANLTLLVNGQQAQIARLDTMVTARDSVIQQVRDALLDCEESKAELLVRVNGLQETVDRLEGEHHHGQ